VLILTSTVVRFLGGVHSEKKLFGTRGGGVLGGDDVQRGTGCGTGGGVGLAAEVGLVLQTPPYRGSLPTAVPSDPLIDRFYELVSLYGTTFKELIHEEFGDGMMSAIDFRMEIEREPDPARDRVKIVMSGKFLGCKGY
jgi:cyanate lyase